MEGLLILSNKYIYIYFYINVYILLSFVKSILPKED